MRKTFLRQSYLNSISIWWLSFFMPLAVLLLSSSVVSHSLYIQNLIQQRRPALLTSLRGFASLRLCVKHAGNAEKTVSILLRWKKQDEPLLLIVKKKEQDDSCSFRNYSCNSCLLFFIKRHRFPGCLQQFIFFLAANNHVFKLTQASTGRY
jgi:hypothetical protein